jgi:hypothetical protein
MVYKIRRNPFACPCDFEEQNKVLEPSITMINYFTNVIIIQYNYTVLLMDSIIIISPIKASSRNEIRKNMWK